jgi:hypothetical protein
MICFDEVATGILAKINKDMWYTVTGEALTMQTVYIKFLTHEDRVRGFFELATRSRIGSLPGEVYQVPLDALQILNDQRIGYRRATDSEVKAANDQVRNPASTLASHSSDERTAKGAV